MRQFTEDTTKVVALLLTFVALAASLLVVMVIAGCDEGRHMMRSVVTSESAETIPLTMVGEVKQLEEDKPKVPKDTAPAKSAITTIRYSLNYSLIRCK